MKQLLLKLDILPQEPRLLFKSQKNHPTVIGLLTSIIFYGVAGMCMYLFGKEMIQRRFPNSSVQSTELQIPPIIGLDPYRMPIAFNLFNYNTNEMIQSEGLFDFEILFKHSKRVWDESTQQFQFDVSYESIKPVQCQRGQHITMPGMQNLFKLNKMEQFLCFPNDKKLYFGGNFALGDAFYMEVVLKYCSESDITISGQQKQCLAKAIINQKLKTAIIAVITPQLNVDLSSKDIIEYFAKLQYTAASIAFTQTIQLYFQQINLIADRGVLIEDIESQALFTTSTYRQFQDNLGENYILKFQLTSQQHTETITVRYKQIQEVIAEIGGFLNITFIILGFLASRFIEIDYYISLIKESMNLLTNIKDQSLDSQRQFINSPSNFDSNQEKAIQPEQQIEIVQLQQKIFPISRTVSIEKQSEKQFLDQLSPRAHIDPSKLQNQKRLFKEVQISTFDQIKLGLCMAQRKFSQFYYTGKTDIENQISIEKLLQLMHEMEILKFLLLDPTHYLLFHSQLQKKNLVLINNNQDEDQQLENKKQKFPEKSNFYYSLMLEKLAQVLYQNQYDAQTDFIGDYQEFKVDNLKLDNIQQRFMFYLDNLPMKETQRSVQKEQKLSLNKISPLNDNYN